MYSKVISEICHKVIDFRMKSKIDLKIAEFLNFRFKNSAIETSLPRKMLKLAFLHYRQLYQGKGIKNVQMICSF